MTVDAASANSFGEMIEAISLPTVYARRRAKAKEQHALSFIRETMRPTLRSFYHRQAESAINKVAARARSERARALFDARKPWEFAAVSKLAMPALRSWARCLRGAHSWLGLGTRRALRCLG